MIDLATARALIDLGARIDDPSRAVEQLRGAVALHGWLERHRVAYLADEVGLGKTYVALATIALYRHFQPDFRVLVIAPKENIQRKWQKEWRNFVRYNMRFSDLRVRGFDGQPVRGLGHCSNLIELVRETTLNPDRDFFARLTSFSLGLSTDSYKKWATELQRQLPWLDLGCVRFESDVTFKDDMARAINCALPHFDLVVVDEAHNLKHGFGANVAARNRVLALTLGHQSQPVDPRFASYGPRAGRVLLMSATPTDSGYRQLWNQLDVLGFGDAFRVLQDDKAGEASQQAAARQFLLRRANAIRIAGDDWTKNQYRREWRHGGAQTFDEPIRCTSARQQLAVALIQKKVSELLDDPVAGARYQIGMLASFESFLETATVKRDENGELASSFDDADQTDDSREREGIDVHAVNSIARDFRQRFGRELPHPKMDALVERLAASWQSGEKHLVFVRRIASVKEIKQRLDDTYDTWLASHLRGRLPKRLRTRLEQLVAAHHAQKMQSRHLIDADAASLERDDDRGGSDTFYAWFFRGEGPKGVISGATIQKRFGQASSRFALFFEENHVARLLDVRPGKVLAALARALGRKQPLVRAALRERGVRFLSLAKEQQRGHRFHAAQAAAIEMLKEAAGNWQAEAVALWREVYEPAAYKPHAALAPDLGDDLEARTFFTALRERPALCRTLWPEPTASSAPTATDRVRERELRARLLAAAARLGHASIDLFVEVARGLRTLANRSAPDQVADADDADDHLIDRFLKLLDRQRRTSASNGQFGAWHELSAIASNYPLLLDVNLPNVHGPLHELGKQLGGLLRQQRPAAGMSGQVNATVVRQFRMPGYPFVLISTDLLQEGEDLHTFCSAVHHYGLSWTPSSMEQRIGRIDRVRSATDRRLRALKSPPNGNDRLQVYYPHLQDTIEVLQVQEVLRRMDNFLRLMHEGLQAPRQHHDRRVDVADLSSAEQGYPQPIVSKLVTAFPLPELQEASGVPRLAVGEDYPRMAIGRLAALASKPLPGLDAQWHAAEAPGRPLAYATVKVGGRQQPVELSIHSVVGRLLIRCKSPVGRIIGSGGVEVLRAALLHARVGLVEGGDSYDLTVEDDVLLAEPRLDASRVAHLVARVAKAADELERVQLHLDQPLQVFLGQLQGEAGRG